MAACALRSCHAVHGGASLQSIAQHRTTPFQQVARSPARMYQARRGGARSSKHRIVSKYTLNTPSGKVTVEKDSFLIGSSAKCDLKDSSAKVFAEHLQLTQRGKQLFCAALDKEGESILDSKTYTWVDGLMIRQGPNYLLSSGTKIAIGNESNTYVVEFEQSSGRNPMMELMLQGMAGSANKDVKKVIDDFLKEGK